jgi:hypothetical protein
VHARLALVQLIKAALLIKPAALQPLEHGLTEIKHAPPPPRCCAVSGMHARVSRCMHACALDERNPLCASDAEAALEKCIYYKFQPLYTSCSPVRVATDLLESQEEQMLRS